MSAHELRLWVIDHSDTPSALINAYGARTYTRSVRQAASSVLVPPMFGPPLRLLAPQQKALACALSHSPRFFLRLAARRGGDPGSLAVSACASLAAHALPLLDVLAAAQTPELQRILGTTRVLRRYDMLLCGTDAAGVPLPPGAVDRVACPAAVSGGGGSSADTLTDAAALAQALDGRSDVGAGAWRMGARVGTSHCGSACRPTAPSPTS